MALGKKIDPNQRIEVSKIVIHPGEINCIKCWSRNPKVIASHTDSRYVFLWDMNAQRNASERYNVEAAQSDLVLEGHTDVAAYALEWNHIEPIVASGGKDK